MIHQPCKLWVILATDSYDVSLREPVHIFVLAFSSGTSHELPASETGSSFILVYSQK